MPTYKYQALLPTGVSVFGLHDSDDQSALAAWLRARHMSLVQAREMSVIASLAGQQTELPRLTQLRVGDRLREALLTDLPAHEALRAMVEEPFEHPVLMTMPWLFSLAVFGSLILLAASFVLPDAPLLLISVALILPVLVVLLWWCLRIWLVVRPRKMLLRAADRFERGEDPLLTTSGLLPRELRAVMNSNLTSQTRALSFAELLPAITGMQLQAHQLAARMVGPAFALAVLLIGVHISLLTVTSHFMEMMSSFGVELPAPTVLLAALTRSATFLGLPGLIAVVCTLAGTLALAYVMFIIPQTAELWESVPGPGLSVRWLMQARVARILSVLIRNRAAPAEAILIASKASGFQSVAKGGQQIADAITSGSSDLIYTRQLSGLPLALLFRSGVAESEETRQETAQAFQTYAGSLEQVSAGHGIFVALLIEMLVIVLAGLLIGFMVLALFMPLFSLMNNLALIPCGVLQ